MQLQKLKIFLYILAGLLGIAIFTILGISFYDSLFSGTSDSDVVTVTTVEEEEEEIVIEVDMNLHNAASALLVLEADEGVMALEYLDLDTMTSLELIRAAYGNDVADTWEDMIKYPNSSAEEFPLEDITDLATRWYDSFAAQNYSLIVSEMESYMDLYSFTSTEHAELTSLYYDAKLMINYNSNPTMTAFVNIASELKNTKCLIIVCLQYDIDLTSMVLSDSTAALRGSTIVFDSVTNYSYGTEEYITYSDMGVLAESFDIYNMTIDGNSHIAVVGHMNDELIMVGFYQD